MLVVLFVWIVSLVVSDCDRDDGQDDESLNAWISNNGSDSNVCSEESACETIKHVGDCFGQNTNVYLYPGKYDIVIVANLSQMERGVVLPYFRILGTSSRNDTSMIVKKDDFNKLHIVSGFSSFQILYCYKAIFSMENMTVDVKELPLVNEESSLVWMHDTSSEASFVSVDFKGDVFTEYLFILTGGNLTLKSVGIFPPNNLLSGNIALWYGTYDTVVHRGSWTIGVEIKNTNYTNSNSLFKQDTNGGILDVSILNSVFENITWDLSGGSSFRRLDNAGEIGLVYTTPDTNLGSVKIADSTFRALDCSTHAGSVKTAPLVIFSSAPSGTALILPNLVFENCSGTAGGTLVTQVDVNLVGYYATGNFRGSEKNDEVIPIGNVAVNYDEKSCTGNRDDTHRTCGDADPKEFPTWALVIIIVIAVVVVAAVIVVIVVAVYFRKKKYKALADDEEFSESSSSLRSSDKENELDSI